MAPRVEPSAVPTRCGPWWTVRIALLLTVVLLGVVIAHSLLAGAAAPRWSSLATCVAAEDAAVPGVAIAVDTSGCSGPASRTADARPDGSVVVAFVLPASAGSTPRVRDVGADLVGQRLFVAYDAAGADVPETDRVVVFVAVRASELPRSPFEIADGSGRAQVWAPEAPAYAA